MNSLIPPDRPRLLVLHGDDLPPGRERMDDHPRLGEVVYTTADELPARLPGAHALLVWDLFTEALTDRSLVWVDLLFQQITKYDHQQAK